MYRRNPSGPLLYSDLIEINEVVFWGKTTPPPVPPLDTDTDYIIQMGDFPDLLAGRRTGQQYWSWVIMERNRSEEDGELDMRLWPNDFVPGATIKIPSGNSIVSRGISR